MKRVKQMTNEPNQSQIMPIAEVAFLAYYPGEYEVKVNQGSEWYVTDKNGKIIVYHIAN